MTGRKGSLSPVVALVGLAFLTLGCESRDPAFPTPSAPPFELESLQGTPVSLSDYTGEIVVLDFWATWCAPCLVQIPILNEFAATRGDGVHVIGVAVDAEGRDVVEEFVESTPIEYLVALGDEALARSYGAPGFPALAVVDRNGRIDSLHVGVISPESLDEAIEAAGR